MIIKFNKPLAEPRKRKKERERGPKLIKFRDEKGNIPTVTEEIQRLIRTKLMKCRHTQLKFTALHQTTKLKRNW